ncbi:hypothetical protein ACF06O_30645 [Streptomyces albidoflavus]
MAVALATAGGVLLYAGFQGLNPIAALKQITSGEPEVTAFQPRTIAWTNDPTTIGGGSGGVVAIGTGAGASGVGARIAAAAQRHRNEKYSQAKRWAVGFSDCSSFVGKALKDVGITPPGGSVTGSYMTWRQLKTVSRAEIQTGDILCGSGHVAIALSPTTAIGQQSSRRNVQTGDIDSIMYGQTGWVPRRYVGPAPAGAGVAAA